MAAAGVEGVGIEAVWQRLRRDWLIQAWPDQADSSQDWFALVQQRSAELVRYRALHIADVTVIPVVLIAEAEPARFLASFWAGLLAGWNVVLANAQWGQQEWSSLSTLVSPDVFWLSTQKSFQKSFFESPRQSAALAHRPTAPESILIPTGGSSGQVKLTHHTWTTLSASANGFLQSFSPTQRAINSLCVLPVYHVSGLMQALRVWLSGGQLTLMSFKRLLSSDAANPSLPAVPSHTFISLVPTQLARLFAANGADWLAQFQAVLLGGAPAWPQLIDQARSHQIPLCLSYGMTETAAMVTALHPQDFLSGDSSSGQVLPHAAVSIRAMPMSSEADREPEELSVGEIGQVVVRSSAIAKGYFNVRSSTFANQLLYTDDLGYLTPTGYLHITGRVSSKIISGGENIYPAEVEAALWATRQVLDVCVVGLPDAQWGEAVTAVYVPINAHVSAPTLKAALTDNAHQLSRYKSPKRWYAVSALPRNAQGKINRSVLMALLTSQLDDVSSQTLPVSSE